MLWIRTLLTSAATLALAACATAGGGENRLVGSSWTAVDIAGSPPLDGQVPTLSFESDIRVNGDTTCNRFAGSYTHEDGEVRFAELISTRRACVGPGAEQEARFMRALEAAKEAQLAEGRLVLDGPAGRLIFARR